eukprot:CAMPEP_0204434358 /NCGR_PEP_ID=MMETSP0470-20130426/71349_1 /ASSEMBLY_ACC=CAM_ASM_000385 /TAXON_ID=2969 /ORGANISM="Oxyrrhis marina" /LENGTH=124 /DNA_ID=CAMNT_0051432837 /DNA_START=378 /DNA_END=752 /DNA_ORIENTATION=-
MVVDTKDRRRTCLCMAPQTSSHAASRKRSSKGNGQSSELSSLTAAPTDNATASTDPLSAPRMYAASRWTIARMGPKDTRIRSSRGITHGGTPCSIDPPGSTPSARISRSRAEPLMSSVNFARTT